MVHHILYIAAYYCDQLTMTMTTMFIDYYVFISFFYTWVYWRRTKVGYLDLSKLTYLSRLKMDINDEI